MQRDIRDLFKEEEELKQLPENHRAEFLEKLRHQPRSKRIGILWLKVVAIAVIALTVGFSVFYNPPIEESTDMIAQIEAVEAQYLEDIEKEWERFLTITDDDVLVERFKNKLADLSNDYQELTLQLQKDANNVLVIEALIDNLQNRLQLLKNIQEHIKFLNQKNEQDETTI